MIDINSGYYEMESSDNVMDIVRDIIRTYGGAQHNEELVLQALISGVQIGLMDSVTSEKIIKFVKSASHS